MEMKSPAMSNRGLLEREMGKVPPARKIGSKIKSKVKILKSNRARMKIAKIKINKSRIIKKMKIQAIR